MAGLKARIVCASVLCAGIIGFSGAVSAQDFSGPQNIGALMQQTIDAKHKEIRAEKDASVNVNTVSPAAEAVKDADALYLTPGKSTVINLDRDGTSAVVTDTQFVNVFLDTPRTLIIVPRKTGATEFTVIDEAGSIILKKTVIVSTETDKRYVRINRICGGNSDCRAQSIYYCGENCVDVTPSAGTQN